jgi:hypothetical protein
MDLFTCLIKFNLACVVQRRHSKYTQKKNACHTYKKKISWKEGEEAEIIHIRFQKAVAMFSNTTEIFYLNISFFIAQIYVQSFGDRLCLRLNVIGVDNNFRGF